ncbi:MAG: amidohydrolase family protein [Eubacteriales bacterium]|nr:amidohydrolase family protein [Eubacteriales bacterium]
MIIDTHTHIFPDKIAAAAIPKLSSVIELEPSMNGTADGLRESMERGNIDLSVILPIVTAPHQYESILRFAIFINETYQQGDRKLLSLASVHPDESNFKEQLRQIQREGFKGIKIHPYYQHVHFDDLRYLRILYAASELGLCIVTHAGYDPYNLSEDFCTPDMIINAVRETAPPKLVVAHMGNNENYDESEAKLCGLNLYMDTAYTISHIEEEQFIRMCRKHGTDKIMFASDAPWADQGTSALRLSNMNGLSDCEKDMILYQNALRFFGIENI